MPANDDDRDRDSNDRSERQSSKQKSSTPSSSKTSKDLSHVPCKFYKVGGCTAGSSCPFSHSLAEPGQPKETCAWFVKGNCKFGHKCALAHILPGQSMAMDRKNKKAAQLAAASASSNERGAKEIGKGASGRNVAKRDGQTPSSSGNRNPLLAGGSTAPTRMASATPTGRPPMSLKATLSPSAPAPPLASFGVLDDLEGDGVQLATAPAQGKQGSQDSTSAESTSTPKSSESKSPEPLPQSAPRSAVPIGKTQQDFGPIGSPPTSNLTASAASARTPTQTNGATFSPGTSPQRVNGINVSSDSSSLGAQGFLSSSPFSAPGAQSVFLSASYNAGGVAQSLGSGLAMMGGGGSARKAWGEFSTNSESLSHSVAPGIGLGLGRPSGLSRRLKETKEEIGDEEAVGDEDLEDFLPSSLTDLLTPEERSRRMSRSNSGQHPHHLQHLQSQTQQPVSAAPAFGAGELGLGMGAGTGVGNGTTGAAGSSHRYSRSVPAPSLLGDIKSIWADREDTSAGAGATAIPANSTRATGVPTHRGTPSQSYFSRFDVNGGHADDMLSMSIGSAGSGMMSLSPSNASAAFLPGLHSHYLKAKASQAQAQAQAQGLGLGGLGRGASGVRGVSNPLSSANYLLGGSATGAGISGSPGDRLHTHTDARTNTTHTYRTTPSPFDLTQQTHLQGGATAQQPPHTARPIPKNGVGMGDEGPHLLSPSARALQSHAPGQSLPQGLAAGYSRIHALPPLSSPGSASLFGGGTPPAGAGVGPGSVTEGGVPSSGPYGGWKPPVQGPASPPSSAAGLEGMFSRLSYSAAAKTTTGTSAQLAPPGLTRNVSGGRFGGVNQTLSPLSGPVVGHDDDELFSMDG
ncbi:hypothetical protein H0H92_008685 [Tricholoma furcatifolium]|nr:hypothetical protein H0H92_008685 [Tricholoma furcatifolium]